MILLSSLPVPLWQVLAALAVPYLAAFARAATAAGVDDRAARLRRATWTPGVIALCAALVYPHLNGELPLPWPFLVVGLLYLAGVTCLVWSKGLAPRTASYDRITNPLSLAVLMVLLASVGSVLGGLLDQVLASAGMR
ncbi:hypothetical protein ACIA8O_38845 [Kitasatospora sp. NPDC051853]|uniref:hypothetical protein n=1 Tax=Kitasatospora sp. NPDC051853 TaxID=3364058 RepID=UPI0037A8E43F